MKNDIQRGVPGVPLAALDAIQDQNTRQVLQAIIDGWHVRNGVAGAGDNRFVTAGELGQLSGKVGAIGQSLTQVESKQAQANSPATINRIITDLQASVLESQLFKELGERITLINKDLLDKLTAEAIARQAAITQEQTTRQTADTSLASQITTVTAAVNQNAAAIQQEVTARASADTALTQTINTQIATVNSNLSALQTQQTTTANNVAALSQSITTLQAQTSNNTIALQTEATVRANADNDIYGKYSVKIDNNGYVTGFGLMSTSNNSTPFSEFIVRADRFAIGTPSGIVGQERVPFIVTTTTDGYGNPPGAYMDMAMIKKASIGSAYIGDAAVDTLKIAGNAVTVPLFVQGAPGGNFYANTEPYTVLQVTGNFPVGSMPIMILAYCQSGNNGNATNARVRVLMDNSYVLLDTAFSCSTGWTDAHVAFTAALVQTAGAHSFQLQLGNNWYTGGPWTARGASLLILGVAR